MGDPTVHSRAISARYRPPLPPTRPPSRPPLTPAWFQGALGRGGGRASSSKRGGGREVKRRQRRRPAPAFFGAAAVRRRARLSPSLLLLSPSLSPPPPTPLGSPLNRPAPGARLGGSFSRRSRRGARAGVPAPARERESARERERASERGEREPRGVQKWRGARLAWLELPPACSGCGEGLGAAERAAGWGV